MEAFAASLVTLARRSQQYKSDDCIDKENREDEWVWNCFPEPNRIVRHSDKYSRLTSLDSQAPPAHPNAAEHISADSFHVWHMYCSLKPPGWSVYCTSLYKVVLLCHGIPRLCWECSSRAREGERVQELVRVSKVLKGAESNCCGIRGIYGLWSYWQSFFGCQWWWWWANWG